MFPSYVSKLCFQLNLIFRLQPHTSPVGVAVKGTHLVENDSYSEILSPPMVNPPTPGAPINSPIFPNLVQHNLGSSEHHAGLPESDIEGISVLVCNPQCQIFKRNPSAKKDFSLECRRIATFG